MVVALKITNDGLRRVIRLTNEELTILALLTNTPIDEALKNWRGGIIPVFNERGYMVLALALAGEDIDKEDLGIISQMLEYISYDFDVIVEPGERVNPNVARQLIDEGYVVLDLSDGKYILKSSFKNENDLQIEAMLSVKLENLFPDENGYISCRDRDVEVLKDLDKTKSYVFTGLTSDAFRKIISKSEKHKVCSCPKRERKW